MSYWFRCSDVVGILHYLIVRVIRLRLIYRLRLRRGLRWGRSNFGSRSGSYLRLESRVSFLKRLGGVGELLLHWVLGGVGIRFEVLGVLAVAGVAICAYLPILL